MTQKTPSTEQMPRILRAFDDERGINWRIFNAIKRVSLRRIFSLVYGFSTDVSYEKPVFIIGVPRSGTTFAFYLLKKSTELGSLQREGHDLWRTFHHPRYKKWESDNLGAADAKFLDRRFACAYLYSHKIRTKRFVEKTPENALRINYLLTLFPDAKFVVMKRNPGDVISSLITGWRHPLGRFRSYYVPELLSIAGYESKRQWCFALIKDWRRLKNSTVPEIAFEQWRALNQALLLGRQEVPSGQWLEVYFEDLLEYPEHSLSKLCEFCHIEKSSDIEHQITSLISQPVNQLSAPGIGKWRSQNEFEIRPFLEKIETVAQELGYKYDHTKNDFIRTKMLTSYE